MTRTEDMAAPAGGGTAVASGRTGAPTPSTPGLEGPGSRASGRALSPAGWTLCAVGAILAVGIADKLSGTDVSLIFFYLVPIALGTWFVNRRAGFLLSVAAAAVSFIADGLYRLEIGDQDVHVAVLAWNGVVQVGTSIALVLMLAALRDRLGREELLARTDALTGIPNRRAFFEAAQLELERARRHRRAITMAYVDVDDFKNVNDQLGHAQGDALLAAVAHTLREATRAVDTVARLGGDEYGLLLPETGAGDADSMLGRLRAAILEEMVRGGWSVGVSMGAATFLTAPGSVDEMMARADELMYAAKRERKGSIRLGVFPGAGADVGESAALPR
ncbi:MAG TPA: GGDEF domain-containing protein [Anaeromyxobacter sp.]